MSETLLLCKDHTHVPPLVRLQVFLVFDFCESNLYEAMTHMSESAKRFSEEQVRFLMSHLLRGLAALHSRGIMHRDVKPDNILLTYGSAKVCDFGQARYVMSSPPGEAMNGPLTDYVATRWYRAPELLLHATAYSPAVDLWAAGCTMAELMLARPLFPGTSELDQLHRIASALGSPSSQQWPSLPHLCERSGHQLPSAMASNIHDLVPGISPEAGELLTALLQWNPESRPTAQAALGFKFFQNGISTGVQPVPPTRRLDEKLTAQADAKLAESDIKGLTVAAAAAAATSSAAAPGSAASTATDTSSAQMQSTAGFGQANLPGNLGLAALPQAAAGGIASAQPLPSETTPAAETGSKPRTSTRVRPGGMLAGLLGGPASSTLAPTGYNPSSNRPAVAVTPDAVAQPADTADTFQSTHASSQELSPSNYVPSFLRGSAQSSASSSQPAASAAGANHDKRSDQDGQSFGGYVPSFLRD